MDDEKFAYSEDYQAKVLAMMLRDPDFKMAAESSLDFNQFSNRQLQYFFGKITSKPLTPVTMQEELLRDVQSKNIREEEIDQYVRYYNQVTAKVPPVEQQHIAKTLTEFIRTQSVKKAILDSLPMIDVGEWDRISEVMQEACMAGLDLEDQGHDYFGQLKDRIVARANKERDVKLSTGIPDLDDLLNGGTKCKQMGMVVGATGRGKSIFLAWLAKVAVLLGKKVVYFTHEMSEEDIAARFDSMLGRVEFSRLDHHNQDVLEKISPMANQFGTSLIIKHYPAGVATVSMLKAFLKRLSASGISPDLVLVDYLDLLKASSSKGARHEELEQISIDLYGMASEFDTRVWTASQFNRAGIVMETPDESGIAGALSKMYTVDLCLFMAQTKEEREDEIMRLVVSKNRNGPAGRTIELYTDYGFMTFFGQIKAQENAEDEDEYPID